MRKANRRMQRRIAATVATGALALAGTALATGVANAAPATHQTSYRFVTLDNQRDLTFNQLLGINNHGEIAGYFGSGAAGHPNKGYRLYPPFGQRDYVNENFPHSVQTQVTGLNDNGVTVGFWSSMNTASMSNNNFGFWEQNGHYHNADFPTGDAASPPVDQLLGVNNRGIAVGFFTNSGGLNRGYEYNIRTHRFTRVEIPGVRGLGPSLTAAAINNLGDVAGFYNKTSTQVDAFLKRHSGKFITLAYPGAAMTQAFGVNDFGEVVGTYTTGTGNAAVTHGFTWKDGKYASVNISGASSTAINGVNDEGDLVGFYTDAKGNTDGLLALP
jgi:probable HAF family extracellular repeat protein